MYGTVYKLRNIQSLNIKLHDKAYCHMTRYYNPTE